MGMSDDLLVESQAGNMLIFVKTAERDRFYREVFGFIEREAEEDGVPEREVLVAVANSSVGSFPQFDNKMGCTLRYFDAEKGGIVGLSESPLKDAVMSSPGKMRLETEGAFPPLLESYSGVRFDMRTCLIVEDAGNFFGDVSRSALRAFTDRKRNRDSGSDHMIIMLSEKQLPLEELAIEATQLELSLPNKEELGDVLDLAMDELSMPPSSIEGDSTREKILEAVLGLGCEDAERTFKTIAVENGRKYPLGVEKSMMKAKKRIVEASGALEFIPEPIDRSQVGGLEVLMKWLDERSGLTDRRAAERNIPPPKGVLFIGPPGTGKSLTSKVVASIFSRTLVRFDVGAAFGGLVGSSEEETRRALKIAEAVAPCVLWIDEIEKALAGGSSGGGDSGTSARVFGTILTWMSDKEADVFVVATANNVMQMMRSNPELLRKGRFDEIFFLDYPGHGSRKKIFEIHLRKRMLNPETKEEMRDSIDIDSLDLDRVASMTKNWTGAEIEQAVISSLISAYDDGDRVLMQKDIVSYIDNNKSDYERAKLEELKSIFGEDSGIDTMRKVALSVGVAASKEDV